MAISLSGVASPGPMTAAALELGSRSRWAGLSLAAGHAMVEVPLAAAIYLGAGGLLQDNTTRIGIGLLGGIYLFHMGRGLLRPAKAGNKCMRLPSALKTPLAAGMALSAGNPYFLLWWTTVGIGLVMGASTFGATGVAIFIIAHWLCDLIWLSALSVLSNKGSSAMGAGFQQKTSFVCGSVLMLFGALFIYTSIRLAANI